MINAERAKLNATKVVRPAAIARRTAFPVYTRKFRLTSRFFFNELYYTLIEV